MLVLGPDRPMRPGELRGYFRALATVARMRWLPSWRSAAGAVAHPAGSQAPDPAIRGLGRPLVRDHLAPRVTGRCQQMNGSRWSAVGSVPDHVLPFDDTSYYDVLFWGKAKQRQRRNIMPHTQHPSPRRSEPPAQPDVMSAYPRAPRRGRCPGPGRTSCRGTRGAPRRAASASRRHLPIS
jgi:hypothetical protein